MDRLTPGTSLNCAEVVRNLWEYLDRRASVELHQAIDEHLDRCEACRTHFEFERRLVKTLSAMRRQHSDRARLREELLRVLRAAGLDDAPHG
jgi:anti-sigma factor (TIGR02949 family)